MISKVTALEKTKSPVEARLKLKPGYGEVMAEQLRTSYDNLAERSAALCALWTSATVSLKSGKDIDCEELKSKDPGTRDDVASVRSWYLCRRQGY